MAGAGYKLFNTGDVLTAAQVNTYLQEQTVMVFADSAARTTALSGVLSEGMVSYLEDSDSVEVYDGSAWTAIGGGSSPLTTKGDLYTYSTTDARLAVGNNGETLVADSSTTTGLRYIEDYAAGKNKIINGDFTINQRGFTSATANLTYGFDRWFLGAGDGTVTYSAQTFTPGAAPVAGYEGTNFARLVTTGQTATSAAARLRQNIEDVRTFAGQTVTVSFWAKASTGTPNVAININQLFGSGGSSAVLGTGQKFAITSSWVRYSKTFTIPSISGKTVGAGSYVGLNLWTSAGSDFNTQTDSLGIQSVTIDLWGVQVEAGSVATALQTATGTLAGELAACQRYYYQLLTGTNKNIGYGMAYSTTLYNVSVKLPISMRTTPTLAYTTGTSYWNAYDGSDDFFDAWAIGSSTHSEIVSLDGTGNVSATAGTVQNFFSNNASAAMGFSAEL